MITDNGLRMPADGTLYQWLDPTGVERNWFALWGLADAWDRLWIYREWPCREIVVPGHGYPGPWAESGTSKAFKHGGIPGAGSRSFGWGLKDYKAEFARLEGWEDVYSDKPVEDWDIDNGCRERVYMRYMDRRFGNTEHMRREGNTTLQDELSELGLWYDLITGHASTDGRSAISHGIDLINDALAYKDPDWLRMDQLGQVRYGPKLFISKSCGNLWFALNHYTAVGGHKEATKDPIDVLRYAMHSKPVYLQDMMGSGARGVGQRVSRLPDAGDAGSKLDRMRKGSF